MGLPPIPGYQLEERLGEGSFGEVWRAIQLSTGQAVAVKLLMAEDLGDLAQEVAMLSKVADHPHVVTLLDANFNFHPPYVVTALLAGSLEPLAEGRTRPPVDEVAVWFVQVAQALQFMHNKGVLHCDLKPANVLFDSQGSIRVVDFGQAHIRGEEGLSLGTFWYMCPEQSHLPLDGTIPVPDVQWDLYSLGATFYQLLTGRLPRCTPLGQKGLEEAADIVSRLSVYQHNLQHNGLVPMTALNPRVDGDLAAIIEHCLELSPERRYGSVGEVLEDMRRRREQYPLVARPHAQGDVLRRFLSRNRLLTGFVMVLTLIVATAFINVHQAEQEARRTLAAMEFQKGQDLAQQGAPESLLWMAGAIERVRGATPDSLQYRRALANRARSLPRRVANAAPGRSINGMWFSSDEARILIGTLPGGLQAFDVGTGAALTPVAFPDGEVQDVSREPDADFGVAMVFRSRLELQVLDLRTLETVGPPRAPTGMSGPPAVSPDGQWMVIVEATSASLIRTTQAVDAPPVATFSMPSTVLRPRFSTDGRRLSIVSFGGLFSMDLKTRQQAHVDLGSGGQIKVCAFSPDGHQALLANDSGWARLYCVDDGRPRGPPLAVAGPVVLAVYSLDGQRVATLAGGSTRIWAAQTGRPLSPPFARGGAIGIAWLRGGQALGTFNAAGDTRLWDLSGQEMGEVPGRPVEADTNFLNDGAQVVTLDRSDSKAQAVDMDSGLLQWSFEPVRSILLSTRAPVAVVGQQDQANIYRIPQAPPSVALGPMGGDTAGLGPVNPFRPDGAAIMVRPNGDVDRCTMDGQQTHVCRLPSGVGLPVLSPDKTLALVALADGRCQSFNLVTGQVQATTPVLGPSVPLTVMSGDGTHALSASETGHEAVLNFWNTRTGEVYARVPQRILMRGMDRSSDGRTAVTLDGFGTVQVWDVATGQPRPGTIKSNAGIMAAVLSPSGDRVLTASQDKQAMLWDTATGRPLWPRPVQHDGAIPALAFSPDGRLVVTGSHDSTARVWDAATGNPVSPVIRCGERVFKTVFSPDGSQIAILAQKGALGVWEARTGQPSTARLRDPEASMVAFSPDGQWLYTASSEHGARAWLVGADMDEPWAQVQLEAELQTGLMRNDRDLILPLTPAQYEARQQEWASLGPEHARHCTCRDANVWLSMLPKVAQGGKDSSH